jgi:hypothetical protein
MAANVLSSPQAIQMSVFVVRAFVRMRSALADTRELARKLHNPLLLLLVLLLLDPGFVFVNPLQRYNR